MSERLLVITEELPSELRQAGADGALKGAYYNPAGRFERVMLIDWGRNGEWPELPHAVLHLPRDERLEAWLRAVQSADFAPLMGEELLAGWPGVPDSWLAAIREFAPTCVRAYGVRWSGWLALELAQALSVPVLCSVHNVIGLSSPVLKRAPALMAVSDEVARACIAAGAEPARVATVPNRVDRDLFSPQGEIARGPAGAPKLLCVARDVEQKNLDRLLQACEAARKQHPELRLVHIGRSSRDWRSHEFVTHIDAVPNRELPEWFRWADAMILPSLWEGFGTVLIEALACGTPVITSNRAPMNEIVTDRWDGLICDPENMADIARAIGEIADTALRARLAAPARTATEKYGAAAVEARESALYAWLTRQERRKVSIVMPTFNRERFIERAVRNVLEQDYPPLELIVVNDGSTDGTANILAGISDPRLRVITQANQGLSGAINAGMAQAGGDYLMWKADDDFFEPGAISALARELALDPEAGLVFADYTELREDGSRMPVATGPVEELSSRNVVGLCFLFRREAWQAAGAVDPGFHLAEDYELWVRMARVTKLRRLARVLYDVTIHPGTLTQSKYAGVLEMTMRVQQHHFGAARDEAWAAQMTRLAGAYKSQGMPMKSLGAALKLLPRSPAAGWWAAVRALTPAPLLRLTRRLRGLRVEER